MEKLMDRRFAAAAMCVMMILGLLLGAYSSGSRLRSAVEDVFYNGELGDGIGVASDMSNRCAAVRNLIVVAKRSLDPSSEALKAAGDAVAMAESASSLADKAEADRALEDAITALYDELGQVGLSDNDSRYRSKLYADFSSYGDSMSHDGYNDSAADYNSKLSAIPGGMLMRLFGLRPAPLFR